MFDAKAARALAAGQHIVIDGAPGLRLEATASVRTWTYRYRSPVDRRMRQVKVGRWPAMGLPAALAAWQALKEQRDAGTDPAAEKRQERRQAAALATTEAYTVRVACSEFLADYKGTVAPKTYREAQRTLDSGIGPIADRVAASITRTDAFDLIHSLRGTPVQAKALRRLLGAVWDRALDAGKLPPDTPNWWRLIMRGRLASRGKIVAGEHRGVAKRALSEAELQQLLPWMPNFSRDVDDALTLVLRTGCRGAEVVAMRAEELADEAGVLWWTIPVARLKMRRNPLLTDLRVPLLGQAAAILQRRLPSARGGWLFPSRGASGHIEQKALGVAVWTHHAACTLRPHWQRPRLPVPNWSPHDLRRTVRTRLAAMGCPPDVAEAILGHMLPGEQATYNLHQYDAERQQWLSAWAARLDQLDVGGHGVTT